MKTLRTNWSGVEKIDGETNWLKQTYEKVFLNYDPYEPIVNTRLMTARIVLFPTDSYHLTDSQFGALRASIESRKDQHFFISEIGWGNLSFQKGFHYSCFRPSFEDYIRLPIGVENAIYGADGTWGLLLSDELHAFLTCDEDFFEVFRRNYRQLENDKKEFYQYWKNMAEDGATVDWFDTFTQNLAN